MPWAWAPNSKSQRREWYRAREPTTEHSPVDLGAIRLEGSRLVTTASVDRTAPQQPREGEVGARENQQHLSAKHDDRARIAEESTAQAGTQKADESPGDAFGR